jgi:hypothetical protein
MKRRSFRKPIITPPPPFVRHIIGRAANFSRTSSEPGQRPRRRKVIVIKQVRWPITNATGKKIRRILIFDNHPDSLRLVFGRRANSHVDLAAQERVSPWELIFVSALTMGALIGMFWPLL